MKVNQLATRRRVHACAAKKTRSDVINLHTLRKAKLLSLSFNAYLYGLYFVQSRSICSLFPCVFPVLKRKCFLQDMQIYSK